MNFLLGQELALYRGLGNYLLFAPRDSVISSNKILFPFEVRRTEKPIFLILKLFFFTRLSRYPASGALCRHHHYITFSILFPSSTKMLINKRRNSDPAAAGGNNANWDITAPRQTEKKATELCSFAIIWWSFLNLFVFSR